MICLVQRVAQAKVEVSQQTVGSIDQGMMVLCGFQPQDTQQGLQKMARKLLAFRIFSDEFGKMNLNVRQINGQLLLVPQFTLAAETGKGNRPSFQSCALPETANQWFDEFIGMVSALYPKVQTGIFGADMQVTLTNDGPVTFQLTT